MIEIQFLTSVEEVEKEIYSLVKRGEKIKVVNLIRDNLETETLISYARKEGVPDYNAIEYSFVFSIIKKLAKENVSIIMGLIGMDKKNIYRLIKKLNKIDIHSDIILIYNSINTIRKGKVSINLITNEDSFYEILSKYESDTGNSKRIRL